ncbi:unnamed protein product [Oreochromis niloticus]|nr:unnamed protein product [Mustela putorius furo]
MEVEALRDKITATLCQLSRDQLIEVGYNVKGFATQLDEPTKDTFRRHLMKVIQHKLDEVENSYTQDDAVQFVKELLSFLGEYKAKDNVAERAFSRPSDERDKYDELQEEIRAIGQKLKMADAAPSLGQNLPSSKVPEVTIRREFCICGQIGEGGSAIGCPIPTCCIRWKMDSATATLKTILKGHYREDDTSDLYKKLINISQDPEESAQDFLFRAIELKDRLLYASKNKEAEHYSWDLVKREFLRSVGTGLQNDNIKFHIKALLDNPEVTDEMLIEKLNEAAKLETERLNMLKRNNTRPPRINELHTRDESRSSSQIPATKEDKKNHPPPEMHDLVKELRNEVAEVRQMVLASLNAGKSQTTKRMSEAAADTRRKKGCRTCQSNGDGDNCTHCFKCGQPGHISRGCRAPLQLQGNARGPLPQDQQ